MTTETIAVELGRTRLTIPVYGDPEKTLQLVARVNEQLTAIEKSASRIDTQTFALMTALHFAAEADRERQGREADSRDLIKLLETLSTTLRALLTKIQSQS
ncbi:MAG TPA: cell division protein ZapA [Candidatus Hydrogenedentes bacterium]|mgnify:CR=1 FL=1|nr:cell division protein ZapA [Candidatus Hydrogenedentota bacterium]